MTRVNFINVLSYNLHYHIAYKEVFRIAEIQGADVICLQECNSEQLLPAFGGYSLACKTKHEDLGLAIYYRVDHVRFIQSSCHMLHKSFYEKLFQWNNERALVAEFCDRQSRRNITIVSLHATHLVASNSLRRRQISEVFRLLEHQNAPVVIAGDYNYPLFHSKLKNFIKGREYEFHTPPDATFKARKYKGKFDFVSTKHVLSTQLSVLPQGGSDHSPIQALIEY